MSSCCTNCSQPYNDPRLLSCLHSFCTACIETLLTGQTISCPSCQHTTSLPNGGLTSLPRNLRLATNEDETLLKITSSPSPSCLSCAGNESSIAYCTECTDFLCKGCWDAHQTVRTTRTHSSFTLEEARGMSREEILKRLPSSSLTCQDHSRQELDFYCQQCAIPVCVKCTIINHRGHTVAETSQQIEKTKTNVSKNMEDIRISQEQLTKVLTTGEEIKQQIKLHKEEVDSTIHESIAGLHRALEQQEKALISESERVATAKETRLSHQLDGIHHLIEAMATCHNLSTTAIGEYSDVELLSVAHSLQARATHLQRKFSKTSLELCETPTISVEVNTSEVTSEILCLGSVNANPMEDTTVVDVPSHIPVGKETNIKIRSSVAGKKFSGRLTPVCDGANKRCVQAKFKDCNDGTYLISLTPKQFGLYQLSVFINKTPLYGSPFSLHVSRDYSAIKSPVQVIDGIRNPYFMAISDDGDIFVTSNSDHCVHVLSSNGSYKTTIGSYGTGEMEFNCPNGIAINGQIVYVAENKSNRIHKFTLEGKFLGIFGSEGSGKGRLRYPWGLCTDSNGKVYVAEFGNHRVQVFNANGSCSHIIDGSGNGQFKHPKDVAFDRYGNLHVTVGTNAVLIFQPDGTYITKSTKLVGPCGITFDPAGNYLVTTNTDTSLVVLNPITNSLQVDIGLSFSPRGVAVAPDGTVWVADNSNNRLLTF